MLQRGEINKNYIQKFGSAEEAAWFEEHWQRIRIHSNLYIACPHCKSVICSFRNFNTHIVNNHHDLYKRCTCLLCNKLLISDGDGDKHKARCMYLNRRRDLDNKSLPDDYLNSDLTMKSKKSNIELDARHSELVYLQNNIKDKIFAINCFLETIQNSNVISDPNYGNTSEMGAENFPNVNNYSALNSTVSTNGRSRNHTTSSANFKQNEFDNFKLMETRPSECIKRDMDTPVNANKIGGEVEHNNAENIPICSKGTKLDFTDTFFHKKRLAMIATSSNKK